MIQINASSAPIVLGMQGENEVRKVAFDVSQTVKSIGKGGTWCGAAQIPCTLQKYPAVIEVSEDGNTVSWIVTAGDMKYFGRGKFQLTYMLDGAVAKSEVYNTVILDSINDTGDVPNPEKHWIDEANKTLDKVKNAAFNVPIISDNGTWLIWDSDTNAYKDSGIPARGEAFKYSDFTAEQLESLKVKGDKGDAGPEGPQGPQGEPGLKGDKGDKGETGEQGPRGLQGEIGPEGPRGLQGEKGERGLTGPQGEQGPIGPVGKEGPQGEPGQNGTDGAKGDKGEPGTNGKDGADGLNGADGVSPTVKTEPIENGHKVTITDKDGAKAFEVLNGKTGDTGPKGDTGLQGPQGLPGKNGNPGANGKSIAWGMLKDPSAVSDSHATINSIIQKHTRIVAAVKNPGDFKNGDIALLSGQYNDNPRQHYVMLYDIEAVKGSNLEGYAVAVIEEGQQGLQGLPGAKGDKGEPGQNGADGAKGDKGEPGTNGTNGKDGKTPLKGTDYWTASDKQEIVDDVLVALPKWKWGNY